MAESVTRHRFTVEDYHRMGEIGIFREDDRVELIRGEVVVMSPIGTRHTACVKRLIEVFDGVRGESIRSVQDPVELPDSEPLPDFVLLARRDDYYASAHPTPRDVQLLVEVSDTTQRYDREVKGSLYAACGIREYWLVDLAKERIEVYRDPEEGVYSDVKTLGRGELLAPEAFPGFEVAVDDVLP